MYACTILLCFVLTLPLLNSYFISFPGQFLLSEHIAALTNSVVIMAGDGSDEVAQGYLHFHKAPSALEADEESRRLLEDLYRIDMVRADRVTAGHG